MSEFYTLTYSPKDKGWPSFYTFNPDWMVNMNQFFYTFKGGNIYKHNDGVRNTYYGTYSPSILKSVFNDMPLDNKVFKALALDAELPWGAELYTDIETKGVIDVDWFEKKEAVHFGFVRNEDISPVGNIQVSDTVLRSNTGLGSSVSVAGPITSVVIEFPLTTKLDSIISIGDSIYFVPTSGVLTYAGVLIAKNITSTSNELIINGTGATPISQQDAYFLSVKSNIAESHGLLGHYCIFKLTNNSINKTEIFAVSSDIMKSFP
jgi:hypothetical protein